MGWKGREKCQGSAGCLGKHLCGLEESANWKMEKDRVQSVSESPGCATWSPAACMAQGCEEDRCWGPQWIRWRDKGARVLVEKRAWRGRRRSVM